MTLDTRFPQSLLVGLLTISVLPFLLSLLGVDFGSQGTPVDHRWAETATSFEATDAHFHALSGAFTHTLLEWSAVFVAIFVVLLSFSLYRINNDVAIPIIGVAFFMAGSMDAFHALAADRLIQAVADNRDLLPFTWAVARAFNALIIIAGVIILLWRVPLSTHKPGMPFVLATSAIFALMAYAIIHFSATSAELPQTLFPNAMITRPYDALPLLLFIVAGLFIYPRLYQRSPSLFTYGLLLSAIPAVIAQLHMAFGSTALFDSNFNIAHFMKIVAYAIPLLGLTLEYVRSQRLLQGETSEREAAETALFNSEAHHRAVIDTMVDSVLTIDTKGIVQSFNPAAENMFGYPASEIIGQNINRLMPEPYYSEHDGYLANHLTTGVRNVLGKTNEVEARHRNGKIFPIELSVTDMQINGQRMFSGIIRDISARKSADKQLSQFKSTLDQTLDCVFMFRADTLTFFYVNQGAIDQVGYGHDELLGMSAFDIKPAFNEQQFRAMIAPMLHGEQTSTYFETIHERKDGSQLPVEIFLQYIQPENAPASSQDGRFVAIVRDISERLKIDKLKDEFVATVSHELRTPLTAIQGSLGLLTGGAVGGFSPQVRTLLQLAHSNSERLLLLINDLLDMEKITTGKLEFNFSPLAIIPFIKESLSANAAYAEQYSVPLIFNPPAEILHVRADADRLMQVMSNLLSNACKFSPQGEPVRIDINRHDGHIRVNVSDNGPGIPEAFHTKLYDKFTQADASDTRQAGGTGLGLSICKAIMEKHGGRIGFHTQTKTGTGTGTGDQAANKTGTTFFFELPEIDRPTTESA